MSCFKFLHVEVFWTHYTEQHLMHEVHVKTIELIVFHVNAMLPVTFSFEQFKQKLVYSRLPTSPD